MRPTLTGLPSYVSRAKAFLVMLLLLYMSRWHVSQACTKVYIRSSRLDFLEGNYVMTAFIPSPALIAQENLVLPEGTKLHAINGRPVYVSEVEPIRYLYHMQVRLGGIALSWRHGWKSC